MSGIRQFLSPAHQELLKNRTTTVLSDKEGQITFSMKKKHQKAFNLLKHALTTSPVLQSPRCGPDAEFIINTDASKYAA